MRPAFRRGWEGEGKLNRRPGAGQWARSDRHSGAAILLWEREGKALGVPTQSGTLSRQAPLLTSNGTGRFPQPHGGTSSGTLERRDADGRSAAASKSLPVVARSAAPAKGCSADRSRASGKERGKSAQRVSTKTTAPSRAQRERARLLKTPVHFLRGVRPALAPVIITGRPRRQERLGGATPRRRVAE